MRPKVIAGNWKMHMDLEGTATLIGGIKDALGHPKSGATVVVCPPFTSLAIAGSLLRGSHMKLGAQNMSPHDEGAYTGEISWKMLRSTGCEYVILGHSERRQYFHETNEEVNEKAKKALSVGLVPIICVGESLEERESGATDAVVSAQVRGVLMGIPAAEMGRVILAYEPVWAIGTGKNATPQQAQEVHQRIRKLIGQLYTWVVAEQVVIQYGGSVKPENAPGLLAQKDIDGALVGGACLKADSFSSIVHALPS